MIRFLALCAVTAYVAFAIACVLSPEDASNAPSPDGLDRVLWPSHRTRLATNVARSLP